MKARPLTVRSAGLSNESVDTINAVIRGVSVITSGLIAKGHALTVDSTTLSQMHACAVSRGQVPVKVDHQSGASAVCGYLDNFRIQGLKLKADWHLLKSHQQTAQILEIAQRMPAGVGLSASFTSPANAEAGKARCGELLSVDFVSLPAANPDGLFDARHGRRIEFRKGDKLRVVGAGAAGAGVGAVGGLALLRAVSTRKLRPGENAEGRLVSRSWDGPIPGAQHVGVGLAGGKVAHTVRPSGESPLRGRFTVKREALDTFAGGQSLRVSRDSLTTAERAAAGKRASRAVGNSGDYNCATGNCEHTARSISGRSRTSPQTRAAVIGAAVGAAGIGTAAAYRLRKSSHLFSASPAFRKATAAGLSFAAKLKSVSL